MKRITYERKKKAMESPKLFLTLENMLPVHLQSAQGDTSFEVKSLPPLYITDLQQLLLYALQGNICSYKPRWCKLLRVMKVSSVVVVLLEGASHDDFIKHHASLPYLCQAFDTKLEMISPVQYNMTVEDELNCVPLSVSQLKKTNVKVSDVVRSKVAEKIRPTDKQDCMEVISRLCLILSPYQLKEERYPMPVDTNEGKYLDYVFSKPKYAQVTANSPMFALDCEMCLTSIHENEVTRVSIVNEAGEVVYDSLVKPWNKIINYLTKYSGITPAMMKDCSIRLEQVQKEIQALLPADAILCGQSLNSDLNALKMFHPYVIDTSVIYNMSGNRKMKCGLKKLTAMFLDRSIQASTDGHCSAEDAIATLDLVKLKLRKGLEFGDATISGIYFPNVQTYFLGEKDGKPGVQNIEKEADIKPLISPHRVKRKAGESSSDENESRSSKKMKQNTEGQSSTSNSNNQMKYFNQNHSSSLDHSFFHLTHEAGRSAVSIGRDPFSSKFEGDPVEIETVASDEEAVKSAKIWVQQTNFVLVKLQAMKDYLKGGISIKKEREDILQTLDDQVKDVFEKAQKNALLAVVMTGRERRIDINNAMTFVKIKTEDS